MRHEHAYTYARAHTHTHNVMFCGNRFNLKLSGYNCIDIDCVQKRSLVKITDDYF